MRSVQEFPMCHIINKSIIQNGFIFVSSALTILLSAQFMCHFNLIGKNVSKNKREKVTILRVKFEKHMPCPSKIV